MNPKCWGYFYPRPRPSNNVYICVCIFHTQVGWAHIQH